MNYRGLNDIDPPTFLVFHASFLTTFATNEVLAVHQKALFFHLLVYLQYPEPSA